MTQPQSNATTQHALRDLVAERLNLHWGQFAEEHPHLAAAIEQVNLVETTVQKLDDDPEFRAAMEAAGQDERTLLAAARLLDVVDRWLIRLLGI